jgi:hypothetical protein
LQANIKFKIVNIAVKVLSSLCNLGVGVPFQESGIGYKEI